MKFIHDIKNDEKYRQIAISAITGIISKAITGGLGLFSVTLAIGYLGKEQYGLWIALTGLVAWMQLTDFGLLNGLPILLSEAYGKDDKKLTAEYAATGLYVSLFLCVIGCLASLLFIPMINIGAILNINDFQLTKTAEIAFIFVLIGFFTSLPFSVIQKLLYSFHLNHYNNYYYSVFSILNILSLILCIKLGFRLEYLILVTSVGPLLANIGLVMILYKKLPWLSLSIRNFKYQRVARLARSSILLFIFQIGALCVNQFVYIIMARKGGLELVADFNVINKIYIFIYGIGTALTLQIYPIVGSLWVKQQYKWIRKAIIRAILIQVSIVLIISIPFLIDGNYLVKLWTTKGLTYELSKLGWIIFVLFMVVTTIGNVFSETLKILDVIRPQIFIVFTNAIVLNATLYFLIEKYQLRGVFSSFFIGAMWGTLGCFVVYWLFIKRQQRIGNYENNA
jgi:O-antigen/teichoic acid export membrane protein